MARRLAGFLCAIAASTLWTHRALADGPQVMAWTVDGDARQGIVYTPPLQGGSGKVPLIFSFHGRGDNMRNFQSTDLHRAYPGAIVAYFQGLPGRRDGVSGWQVERGQDNDRDLKLVDVALADLRQRFRVDDARIYSTGFSNGAIFTYLLWSERSEIFAAYAPVAGRLRPSIQLKRPRPVIHIAGTEDKIIPFAAQTEAIEITKRVDGVSSAGSVCGAGCTLYSSGAAPVMTWIHPGGHEYPDGTSERISKFFRDHPSNR